MPIKNKTPEKMFKITEEALVAFFCMMDFDLIKRSINEDTNLEPETIQAKLSFIDGAFSDLGNEGDTKLTALTGFCINRDCDRELMHGYTFEGNNSGKYITYIFIIKDGLVSDIHPCRKFKCFTKDLNPKKFIDVTSPF
jgi:hypothetical protein